MRYRSQRRYTDSSWHVLYQHALRAQLVNSIHHVLRILRCYCCYISVAVCQERKSDSKTAACGEVTRYECGRYYFNQLVCREGLVFLCMDDSAADDGRVSSIICILYI
jgi:phage gp36-like protein